MAQLPSAPKTFEELFVELDERIASAGLRQARISEAAEHLAEACVGALDKSRQELMLLAQESPSMPSQAARLRAAFVAAHAKIENVERAQKQALGELMIAASALPEQGAAHTPREASLGPHIPTFADMAKTSAGLAAKRTRANEAPSERKPSVP